jgi:hypothetical protein
MVIGVWAGNNNRYPLQQRGGSVLAAVPMWHDFASEALKTRPSEVFNRPDPIATSTPILRGELDTADPHNILHYLNQLNDPQYPNWEEGVQQWLKTNNITLSTNPSYSYSNGENPPIIGSGPLTINGFSLNNGDFISSPTNITADISASGPQIKKIELYLNDNLIDSRIGDLGANHRYEFLLDPNIMRSQNKLVIRASDASDGTVEKEVILYK